MPSRSLVEQAASMDRYTEAADEDQRLVRRLRRTRPQIPVCRLEGPATVLFLINQTERSGGSPKLRLVVWSRARGVAENDCAKHELRCLCKALPHFGRMGEGKLPQRKLSCIMKPN